MYPLNCVPNITYLYSPPPPSTHPPHTHHPHALPHTSSYAGLSYLHLGQFRWLGGGGGVTFSNRCEVRKGQGQTDYSTSRQVKVNASLGSLGEVRLG